MRLMPTFVSRDPMTGKGAVNVPVMSRTAFDREIERIAGRPLTADEQAAVDKMSAHNWTLRVIADKLFGEQHVNEWFAANRINYS